MNKMVFNIGKKIIGDGNVLIQSMSDKKTDDIDYQIKLTNDLEKMSLDMMRFSILDENDAIALKEIKKNTNIPIIADIHYDYRLALLALDNDVDKIRINPGNIGSDAGLREIINACKEKNIPIRIGVNSGSLNKYLHKTSSFEDDYLLAIDETINIFKSEGFDKLVLSLKSSDPNKLAKLYTKAYEKYPYPLHIGLTESGFGSAGIIKSAYSLIPLLSQGIGDTLRVSLTANRVEEVRACKQILKLANRIKNVPNLITCPGCGRTLINLKEVASYVESILDYVNKDITIAVMGCPVNGIGEAKDADIGITGSGRKDEYIIFEKGKQVGPAYQLNEALSLIKEKIEQF